MGKRTEIRRDPTEVAKNAELRAKTPCDFADGGRQRVAVSPPDRAH